MLSDGAPGRIRTPDPQIRSLVLYPAELPVLNPFFCIYGDASDGFVLVGVCVCPLNRALPLSLTLIECKRKFHFFHPTVIFFIQDIVFVIFSLLHK